MSHSKLYRLRTAGPADLPAVNEVIAKAIGTWDIPPRVRRLSVPLFSYSVHDLEFLDLVVAEAAGTGIVGLAAWEQADPGVAPAGCTALLLHGIYVAPEQQRKGVGTRLLSAAEKAASGRGLDGVVVKAQPHAGGFFLARGMELMPFEDCRRDYPYRFWLPLKTAGDAGRSPVRRHG